MALTAQQILEARSPSLVGSTRTPTLLLMAQDFILATVYGLKAPYAQALLVLHWLAMENRLGAAGALVGESEGQLSRSYSVQKGAFIESDLSTTSWGQELQRIQRGVVITPINRMVDIELPTDCSP